MVSNGLSLKHLHRNILTRLALFTRGLLFISLPAVLVASCYWIFTHWLRLTASPNSIKLFHWRVPALILLLDLYSMIEIDHLAEQHQITDSSFSNPTSLQIDHLQESFASWLVWSYVFWKMITQMTLSNGASTYRWRYDGWKIHIQKKTYFRPHVLSLYCELSDLFVNYSWRQKINSG